MTRPKTMDPRLIAALPALSDKNESTRLKAALALGSHPDPAALDILLARCAVESDFYVRDMLTWAVTRLPRELTVPRLIMELQSPAPQARAQALHTLAKIKDASSWPAFTRPLLHDAEAEVARSAWRAAVVLVPHGQERQLAAELAAQLGRGGPDLQLSLSRALAALGEDAVGPVLRQAMASPDPTVREHARAAEQLLHQPDTASAPAVKEARRLRLLGPGRQA